MEIRPDNLCNMLSDVICDEDCDEKVRTECEKIETAIKAGDLVVARCLLRRKRSELLDKLHESQKNLDSLDYILYQMEKLQKL